MATILLIEDCDEVREMLAQTLGESGHTITATAEAAAALAHLRQSPVDLVITDIYLPDMDGLQLLAALRRLPSRPPVLAISGNTARADSLRLARHLGARRTLQKPFPPHVLREAVDQLLAANASAIAALPQTH